MSKKKKTDIVCALLICSLIAGLAGCEAFVKKFTRKPKDESRVAEEMVLMPQEYVGPKVSFEELYHQNFFLWKSWHDEFIAALAEKRSQKKQIDCLQEAVKSLESLKSLLSQENREKLDGYILQENQLKDAVTSDIYGNRASQNMSTAEGIRRNILRDFSFHKIKDSL